MEGLTIGMQNKTILERKQTMKPVKEVDEEHDNEQFQAAFTIQKKYRDYMLEQYKTGLSSFNDKIWMRKVDVKEWDTHSFGHYNIR